MSGEASHLAPTAEPNITPLIDVMLVLLIRPPGPSPRALRDMLTRAGGAA